MLEIRRGEADVTEGEQLTLDVRRDCDAEYLRRAEAFMRGAAGAGTPVLVYFNHSLMHMPVLPREEFEGATGQGDWADSLYELDADFGTLLDLLDELGAAEDTVVVFAATTALRRCCSGGARPASGRARTSPAARATCARRASSAAPGASKPGVRATRSCTSRTG